jgi:hypothetical protein
MITGLGLVNLSCYILIALRQLLPGISNTFHELCSYSVGFYDLKHSVMYETSEYSYSACNRAAHLIITHTHKFIHILHYINFTHTAM